MGTTMTLKITVQDAETGEQLGSRELHDDDYFVIATGSCTYSVQAHGNGTHVVTFKGRKEAVKQP
jgi:hypothetical protein